MQAGRIQLDDRLSQTRFARQHFGQTMLGFDSQIVGGARLSQISVDNQRGHAVGLRQQPREIQSG